jgi:uncharacterized protein with ParB-like and HNH nuclease domain
MKTGNYSIVDIFENRDLEQLVIPEIQRDYVWKINDVLDFLSYIKEGFDGDEEDQPYLGFIYAYNDRDYPFKYFLIDGQQRVTTIYLLLLACYHKFGKGLPDYMFNRQQLKIDYKVRQATHDLITDLVNFCKDNPALDFTIENQIWFHKEYITDRTINNIIANSYCIYEWLEQVEDLPKFIKFIEDEISLSYYHVEESRQGEDLYIYMNSRGRQLEPNETLKAKFLAKIENKNSWGTKWELWQDFFWKQKGSRPDADAGFNDFLRMVQIIQMSYLDFSADEISNFASGKGNQDPSFEKLPQKIEELESFYNAFHWLVTSPEIIRFFEQHEKSKTYVTSTPTFDRRQIFFLRVLPVLSFLSVTGCRDETVIIRFVRFFYNISRKTSSIGKDIANQLPNAIKLMLEYGLSKQENYDICDLVNYSKGRTVLINDEEVIKLTIFKKEEQNGLRSEIENLFWIAEDHAIFNGEIKFFLNQYYDENSTFLNIKLFKKTWEVFESIFSKNKNDYSKVTVALLYYGYTWTKSTPNYYDNYDCQDWFELVRSKNNIFLTSLLEDLHDKPIEYLDTIIVSKIKNYFKSKPLETIELLKAQSSLIDQIRVLCALDYFSDKKMFKNPNGYIAIDPRYDYKDKPFFNNKPELFNVYRYINEGVDGRLMKTMKLILEDDDRLNKILENIFIEVN